MTALRYFGLALLLVSARTQKIVLTNDDGWAVAQIRAEYEGLTEAGYEVILSCPAQNWSGSGSLSVPALPTVRGCEFDSCPAFSPAYGYNRSDTRLNYVNAAPSDASHYGITTLALETWCTQPDLVVSGPNVGNNIQYAVFGSGTIGAASRAVADGVPAVAFSGSSLSSSQEAWTLLSTSPPSSSIIAARTYASLSITFLRALFAQPATYPPLLPKSVVLNVNFPPLSTTCPGATNSIRWTLTRALPAVVILGWTEKDVEICGNGGRLPTEANVMARTDGCYATVSVLDASTKTDANAYIQADLLQRLRELGFSCLPPTA
ncbi:survival protein sure-like phosphatase/nucleotidase [Cytidiella melzeri]|nr:survival protein sure-like phosphatase/nucleotidase [Cytidiella melzeri]